MKEVPEIVIIIQALEVILIEEVVLLHILKVDLIQGLIMSKIKILLEATQIKMVIFYCGAFNSH